MTLIAASGLAGLLTLLLVLACPLMMIFMMRGMHGGHGHGHAHGHAEPTSREQMSMEELEQARDELNDEIGRRAEQEACTGEGQREAVR